MKAGASGMPGSIAACAVSCRLCRVNFAGAVTRSDKAETEAFQASGGLNASRIQVNTNGFTSDSFPVYLRKSSESASSAFYSGFLFPAVTLLKISGVK
jgi:hypothetical protein